jgi:hypothetical protein
MEWEADNGKRFRKKQKPDQGRLIGFFSGLAPHPFSRIYSSRPISFLETVCSGARNLIDKSALRQL